MDKTSGSSPWNRLRLNIVDFAPINASAEPDAASLLDRLHGQLKTLRDRAGQTPAKPDAAMYDYLMGALTPDRHSYAADVASGKSPATVVMKNEIGQHGLIGFPGYTTTPRKLYDALSSKTPHKDIIAQALGAKSWEEMYPAFQQQFAREAALNASAAQTYRQTPDVHGEFRQAAGQLQVAVDGKRQRGGLDAPRVIATFTRMQAIHAAVVGVYEKLEAEGMITAPLAREVQSRIKADSQELRKPTAREWLGDWAPHATASLRAVTHVVERLNRDPAHVGGAQSALLMRSQHQMELLGEAWEAAKDPNPRDRRVQQILTRVEEIGRPSVVEIKPALEALYGTLAPRNGEGGKIQRPALYSLN